MRILKYRSLILTLLLFSSRSISAQKRIHDFHPDTLSYELLNSNSFQFTSNGKKGFYSINNNVFLAANYDEIRINPYEVSPPASSVYDDLYYFAVKKGSKWALYKTIKVENTDSSGFVLVPGYRTPFVFDSVEFKGYARAVGLIGNKVQNYQMIINDEETIFETYDAVIPDFDPDKIPYNPSLNEPDSKIAVKKFHSQFPRYQMSKQLSRNFFEIKYLGSFGVYSFWDNRIFLEPKYQEIHYVNGIFFCIFRDNKYLRVIDTTGNVNIDKLFPDREFYWKGFKDFGCIGGRSDEKFVIMDSNLKVLFSDKSVHYIDGEGCILELKRNNKSLFFSLATGKLIREKIDRLVLCTDQNETVFKTKNNYYLYSPVYGKSFKLNIDTMYKKGDLVLFLRENKCAVFAWNQLEKNMNSPFYDSIVEQKVQFLRFENQTRRKREILNLEPEEFKRYYKTCLNGKCGLIDQSGKIRLNPEYDSIVYNVEIPVKGFNGKTVFFLKNDGSWTLCMDKPENIIETGLLRIEPVEIYNTVEYIAGRRDGLNIFESGNGWILPEDARSINRIIWETYAVKYEDGYHLLNLNPNGGNSPMLDSNSYDSIWLEPMTMYFLTRKANFCGVITSTGSEIIAPDCDSLKFLTVGYQTMISTYKNGKVGYLIEDKREPEIWDEMAAGSNGIIWTRLNGKWFLHQIVAYWPPG